MLVTIRVGRRRRGYRVRGNGPPFDWPADACHRAAVRIGRREFFHLLIFVGLTVHVRRIDFQTIASKEISKRRFYQLNLSTLIGHHVVRAGPVQFIFLRAIRALYIISPVLRYADFDGGVLFDEHQ